MGNLAAAEGMVNGDKSLTHLNLMVVQGVGCIMRRFDCAPEGEAKCEQCLVFKIVAKFGLARTSFERVDHRSVSVLNQLGFTKSADCRSRYPERLSTIAAL